MGSTTKIYVKIIKKLNGDNINTNIELIYQNIPFIIKCKCKLYQSIYIYEDNLLCSECSNDIDNEEYLPI